jgi:hypothetical protein
MRRFFENRYLQRGTRKYCNFCLLQVTYHHLLVLLPSPYRLKKEVYDILEDKVLRRPGCHASGILETM